MGHHVADPVRRRVADPVRRRVADPVRRRVVDPVRRHVVDQKGDPRANGCGIEVRIVASMIFLTYKIAQN